MRTKYLFGLFSLALLLVACDRGLAPLPASTITSISGRIHFVGSFPPCDSVKALAVVLSAQPAPFSVSDILNNYNVSIFAVPLAPCSFADTSFVFEVAPNTYRYLGVAQLFGDSVNKDWRIVGFAHTEQDSAEIFSLSEGESVTGVELRIRFDSLPRQPFIQ